jgi:hypothetical protein
MTKARVNADNASADIQGVTAGTGLTGGGTSGTVTLTNDMATVIDAKGDLVVGTGADTYDNLAVGNNGDTLVADSSATTGLRYQAPVNANPVLNSNFSVWQRGTSFVGSTGNYPFTADRWQMFANQDQRVSRQATGDSTNLPFIQYCARVGRVASSTSGTAVALDQPFETVNSIPYAGKTVTVSFYARKGANFSVPGDGLYLQLIAGTGTDQSLTSGFTGQTNIISQQVTLTTTWQRFTISVAVGSTYTQLAIRTYYIPTGTAGASDYYEITGVQLEVGSVATPYKPNGATIQGELAACQRYYQILGALYGYVFASTSIQGTVSATVMRTQPTVLMRTSAPYAESPINVTGVYGVNSTTVGSPNNNEYGNQLIRVNGFSGLTTGTISYISSNQIALSAEL